MADRNGRRREEDEETNAAERLVRAGAPDAEKVKQLEAEKTKGLVRNEALRSGKTEEEANAAAASTGLNSATPRLDQGVHTPNLDKLARTNSPMGGGGETAGATVGFKSSGEEYMFKAKNAIRALQGLPAVEQELNPRDKFQVDVEKSVSFGDKSALNTPDGHARAFERGIRAGYSSDEVNGMLKGASDRLKPTEDATVLADARPADARTESPLLTAFNNPSNTNDLAASIRSGGSNTNKGIGILPQERESKDSPITSAIPNSPATPATPTAPTTNSPLLTAFNSPNNTKDLASSIGGSASMFGVTKAPDATPNSPTIGVTFTPAESEEDKKGAIAFRYANLVNEKGYTPNQAADLLGLKDGKAPEGFEGTGVGNLIKSANSYRDDKPEEKFRDSKTAKRIMKFLNPNGY